MKKSSSSSRYSNDYLNYDILVRIFMTLSTAELLVVPLVCKSWMQASRSPSLWNKLDLTTLHSSIHNVPKIRNTWNDICSQRKLDLLLKFGVRLGGGGNIRCLIFNYYVYLSDFHLITAAERTPNLRRLVFPDSGYLSKDGIYNAMRLWGGLVSMTITSIVNRPYMFSAIGKYCKNLSQLKLTFNFEQRHADALVKHTPNLMILSIRDVTVNLRALCHVLKNMERLLLVNICHSITIWDRPDGSIVLYEVKSLTNHLSISCLKKIISCEVNGFCRCQRPNYDPRRHPDEKFEDIWRYDEVTCLGID
ncbi:F-box/LRR-repeat protein At3g48880-like [Lotus japonicus]|uniref:F-box/LRR-repeat protein At3g48880-like n=1 Tax=Lotus japonicus TaxID=34305 RepID=UPI0025867469|nr:F-box/LRR-repeat protein At3g48880-like [Lotus japonicus]